MRFCLIDFETASACDLKKAGAWRYAEDPTTEILCLGYTIDGGEPHVLFAQDLACSRDHMMRAAVAEPTCIFIAHNVQFEKAIWRNLMIPMGWPDIPNERWHDIMAVCAMKGLPLKLEQAAAVLRLGMQKDIEGTRATVALSRPNKKGFYDRSEEKLARVYAYNAQDVRAELELHRRVKGQGAAEREVWLLDQKINERGVKLDLPFIEAAWKICQDASKPLLREFQALTGIEKVGSPKFLEWIKAQGADLPNLQKATIDKVLGDDDEEESLAGDAEDYSDQGQQFELPAVCRRPLEIRKVLGSASIKKLPAMLACCCADGRARGLLQYHGAGPGRWAGRLLQPQNFPRPTLKQVVGFDKEGREIYGGHDPNQLVAAVLTGDSDFVGCLFGEPITAISNGLRHCLVADHGYLFEVGDFAKIECVIVLALAGAPHTAKKVIESGSAVYLDAATKLYKRPITKADLKEYTVGKANILACGFQLGHKGFKIKFAPDEPEEICRAAIDWYRQEFAPEVPRLWYALEDAAVKAAWDRRPQEAYGIEYRLEDAWLTARLPSGRRLWYFNPQPVEKHMPWSTPEAPDVRRGFTYQARKMGKWLTIHAYGGLLTENVVQAMARDLLVHGMFNSERAGHPCVLTVHDELITEVPKAIASASALDGFLTDAPAWARALHIPVASECWIGPRYKK